VKRVFYFNCSAREAANYSANLLNLKLVDPEIPYIEPESHLSKEVSIWRWTTKSAWIFSS